MPSSGRRYCPNRPFAPAVHLGDAQPGHSTRTLPTRDPAPERSGGGDGGAEIGQLSLIDSLAFVACYARTGSPTFDRASVRWLTRLADERDKASIRERADPRLSP
jgi:hypothetical protein